MDAFGLLGLLVLLVGFVTVGIALGVMALLILFLRDTRWRIDN